MQIMFVCGLNEAFEDMEKELQRIKEAGNVNEAQLQMPDTQELDMVKEGIAHGQERTEGQGQRQAVVDFPVQEAQHEDPTEA